MAKHHETFAPIEPTYITPSNGRSAGSPARRGTSVLHLWDVPRGHIPKLMDRYEVRPDFRSVRATQEMPAVDPSDLEDTEPNAPTR